MQNSDRNPNWCLPKILFSDTNLNEREYINYSKSLAITVIAKIILRIRDRAEAKLRSIVPTYVKWYNSWYFWFMRIQHSMNSLKKIEMHLDGGERKKMYTKTGTSSHGT